ncbi:MAG: endonuclease III domain-containing protein [Candidatus Aenigmatarchaeota archaeon]
MKAGEVYGAMLTGMGRKDWWHMERGFSPPQFEVCLGAILTQNTNWRNVERALALMIEKGLTTPEKILSADMKTLEDAVRPSGFYKQKAQRLKLFAGFVSGFGGFPEFSKNVTREELLKLKGIGPETADSILLYALGRPVFVIDAYTKRIFTRLGFPERKGYEEWRRFFEDSLPRDVKLYKEFHALIVEHAKRHCRKEPLCEECFLNGKCARKI